MENIENIDEYVSGKMDSQEREAFEQKLSSDPTLQSEVAIQKAIIEGVKKARMAELKGMLSQVPITGLEGSLGISVVKIAATIVSAGILVTASLLYFNQSDHKSQVKTVKDSILEKIEIPSSSIPTLIPDEEKKSDSTTEKKPETSGNPNSKISKQADSKKVTPMSKPKIDVVDPSEELGSEPNSGGTAAVNRKGITTSHIPVETNDADKKYSFHYQFTDGKLVLYGSFDKGLYEVIEVNGETRSLFLFYKENFYLINEKKKQITPLKALTDSELISKLKEYRSK